MDIISILKNKFVLSFILSLILLVCLYQFEKIKSKDDKNENSEETNIIYYCKYLVLFYILSFVLVLSVSKGYEYYTKNNLLSLHSQNNQEPKNEEHLTKIKLLEERKKMLELKKQEQLEKQEPLKKQELLKKQEQSNQKGGEVKKSSFTIETIDETQKNENILEQKKKEQSFNMGNPNF